jgi:hypothetical protein
MSDTKNQTGVRREKDGNANQGHASPQETIKKQAMPARLPYYFQKTDPIDQAIYRLLMRRRPKARTAFFREMVLGGYQEYLKKTGGGLTGSEEGHSDSPTSDKEQPVKTSRPLDKFQR